MTKGAGGGETKYIRKNLFWLVYIISPAAITSSINMHGRVVMFICVGQMFPGLHEQIHSYGCILEFVFGRTIDVLFIFIFVCENPGGGERGEKRYYQKMIFFLQENELPV